MKYIIHGAINGSNFGDCLFAHIFYRYFSKKGNEISFVKMPYFGLCDYLNEELDIDNSQVNYKKTDGLIYMSGGYFGDTNGNIREAVYRYFRYFFVAEFFMKMKKPIYICGIGGGPINNKWLRKKAVRVLNYATYISVRDFETKEYFSNNGVNKPILVTTDTALILGDSNNGIFNYKECKMEKNKNSKILFLHVYGSDKANQDIEIKILPAVNCFLEKNHDWKIIVGTDNKINCKIEDLNVYKMIEGKKSSYQYSKTLEMLEFLNSIDATITTKLHVGIVASVFGKSVISFPKHKFKTKRFYEQIEETERCLPLNDCDSKVVLNQINKYINRPISVDKNLILKAFENLNPLNKEGVEK